MRAGNIAIAIQFSVINLLPRTLWRNVRGGAKVRAAMYGEVAHVAPGFESLRRHYNTLQAGLPARALSGKGYCGGYEPMAWPSSPTQMVDIAASHEVIFSQPSMRADMLIAATG